MSWVFTTYNISLITSLVTTWPPAGYGRTCPWMTPSLHWRSPSLLFGTSQCLINTQRWASCIMQGLYLELFGRFGKACLRPACQTVQRMLWPGLEDHLRQVKDLLSLVTFIFCVKYFALLLGESTQVKYAQLTDPCNLIQVTQFQGFCPVFFFFFFPPPFYLVGRPWVFSQAICPCCSERVNTQGPAERKVSFGPGVYLIIVNTDFCSFFLSLSLCSLLFTHFGDTQETVFRVCRVCKVCRVCRVCLFLYSFILWVSGELSL